MGWMFNPVAWILFKLYGFMVPKKYWREEHQMILVVASFILTIAIIVGIIFWLYPLFIRH